MTAQRAAAFFRAHDNYLILTHRRPDGDTLGCAVALCRVLRGLGKTAWMAESRDAIHTFRGYLEGNAAPGGFTPETVVAVDVADEGLLPPNMAAYKGKVDLGIDHHPSNSGFARESWVEADKAACGELIYELANELGVMDAEIAQALYVAVSTDTGCFVYGNTTPNTHRVAAALMERGAHAPSLNKRHFRTKSLKRLKLESVILGAMELHQGGTVAVAPVTLDMMAAIGATEDDADDVAAFVGQVEGVLHAVTIRELRPGECKVSLRTQAEVLSASAVCARLGGGGHAGAAGCTLQGTVTEAAAAVLAAIEAAQRGE